MEYTYLVLSSVIVFGWKSVDHAAPGARPPVLHLKVEAALSQGHFDVVVPVLHRMHLRGSEGGLKPNRFLDKHKKIARLPNGS